jgi:NifU-like protein involved in Fe-S cluster formation
VTYNDLTRRYFEAPANAGVLADPAVFRGSAGDRGHGTWVQFDLKTDAGTVLDARFLAFGCPHVIAVSAWLAEQAVGRPLAAALPESVQTLRERFAIPPEKLGRLLVIEDAWAAAAAAALGPLREPGLIKNT